MERDNDTLPCEITRRHALQIAIQGGIVLVGAFLPGQAAEGAGVWERVGTIAQFPIGVPRLITLSKGKTIYVLREDRSHWLALDPQCTHKGAEIHWNPEQKRFVCPLHGASFGVNGQNPTGPARKPLAQYPTQVKGKEVRVDVAGVPAPSSRNGGKKRQEKGRDHDEDEKEGHEKDADK